MSWGTNPLYALLHESIYCQGAASNWAAHRVREQHYAQQFDAVAAVREGKQLHCNRRRLGLTLCVGLVGRVWGEVWLWGRGYAAGTATGSEG
jgi:hypothetical protein